MLIGFFEELMGDELHGSIERVMRGGDVLKCYAEEAQIESFKAIFVGLCVVLHGVPRVMLRDTCAEYDEQKKGQRVALIFVATVVLDQGEAFDETG